MFSEPLFFKSLPKGVKGLLVANVAVFLAQWFYGPQMVSLLGLTPYRVVHNLWLWQPVTYLFLHSGSFHILLNMYMLWSCGREIEYRWGTPRFLFFYFLCGLGAAALNVAFSPHAMQPAIGASGAIYGILVAIAFMFPNAVFRLYFLVPLRAWQAVILFAVIEFMISLSGINSGMATFAHLGGMLTGFLYMKSGTWRLDFRNLAGRAAQWKSGRAEAKRTQRFHDLGQEVDRILEKISKQGIGSLSREEEELMRRYSGNKK
jgi:membrane associated rhomboid family serine protease